MAKIDDIRKRLKDRLVEAPKASTKKGRIEALLDEVDTQRKSLAKMAKAKTKEEQKEAVVPQSSWIKIVDFNHFTIKIGRAGYPYYDEANKHFKASSVDEASAIIDDIEELAKSDEAFKEVILDYVAPKKAK